MGAGHGQENDEKNGIVGVHNYFSRFQFFPPGSRSGFIRERLYQDSFTRLKLIGRGHFSKVYLVRKVDSGNFYAMKVMQKRSIIESKKDIAHVLTERKVLECFSHPFIVNGGELYYHLSIERRLSESRVKLYAAEIFLALAFMHEHNIIYRDLKLENVLLDAQGHCVIADFNFSKLLSTGTERTWTFCGTVDYIAPEVLLQASAQRKNVSWWPRHANPAGYSFAVDWWSLGILVHELIYGLPPFYGHDVNEAYYNILHQRLTFSRRIHVSYACIDFMSKLLKRDPAKRLNCEGIQNHPWFADLNWADVYQRKIQPEFVPKVRGPSDTTFFDGEFLSCPIEDEPVVVDDPKLRIAMQEEFLGFSFDHGRSMTPPSSSVSSPIDHAPSRGVRIPSSPDDEFRPRCRWSSATSSTSFESLAPISYSSDSDGTTVTDPSVVIVDDSRRIVRVASSAPDEDDIDFPRIRESESSDDAKRCRTSDRRES